MTDLDSTAVVVKTVNHPAIRLQLDLGAMTITGESIVASVRQHGRVIGHIHASEPNLVPLGDGGTDHAAAAVVLRQSLPDLIVAIEVKATDDRPHLETIKRSLDVACRIYR
jgi:sugar phosphate isomerase/epimerase